MADRVPPRTAFSIVVRKRHYQEAEVGSAARCVIAVALKEAFPDVGPVQVGFGSFAVTEPDDLTEWRHDGDSIVVRFDNGFDRYDTAPPVQHVTFRFDGHLSYGEVERRDGPA
jgi:hypothetical protein